MSTLSELQEEREQLGGQLLGSLVQIILLLLVPVLFAVLFGNYLNNRFQTGSILTFVLALVATALSWLPIWKIYKRIDQRMVELDTLIRIEREKEEK
jgi:ABC-type phosphate transport system permease subunit